jgi:hypothetical protein
LSENEKRPGSLLAFSLWLIPKGGQKRLPAFAPLTVTAPAAIPAGEAATAALTPFLRPGFVDGEATSLEFLLIQRFARRPSLSVVVHYDEAEAARTPGLVIADQTNRGDVTERREELLELRLFGIKRQISYVDLHWHIPVKGWRRELDNF